MASGLGTFKIFGVGWGGTAPDTAYAQSGILDLLNRWQLSLGGPLHNFGLCNFGLFAPFPGFLETLFSVTLALDYYNALYNGLPLMSTRKLQLGAKCHGVSNY